MHPNPSGQFKPGNPYAWQKGKSANPGGVGRAEREVREFCQQVSLKLAKRLFSLAMDDATPPNVQVLAAGMLFDRGFGKARERVEVDATITPAFVIPDRLANSPSVDTETWIRRYKPQQVIEMAANNPQDEEDKKPKRTRIAL